MNDIELRVATKIDEQNVNFLVAMINEVYQKSEGNIWKGEEYDRISNKELLEIIQSNELLLAQHNNDIYGCVHLEKKDASTYKFKILVANPKFKGKGIGSLLVNFAEQQAKTNGATVMQLDLLVPTTFEHPDKVFLAKWYSRIGYKKIEEHDVERIHPGVSKFLKTNCVVKVYEKVL